MSSDITTATGNQLVPAATSAADVTVAGTTEASTVEAGTIVATRTQRGMVSAEWAVGIIAAIAIAGVLLAVVTSGPVESALLKVILAIIKTFTRNL